MSPNTTPRLLACCGILLVLLFSACKKNAGNSSSEVTAPQLIYTPDTAIVLPGVSDTSVTPLINWHGQKGSFAFAATPVPGIIIDNLTGRISWTATLPVGTWLLPVIARNASGADTVMYMLNVSGPISTIAGSIPGFSGDGGPALNALLDNPSDVAIDAQDNIYIADTYNNRVRVIHPDGVIQTFAGNGTGAFAGDGGPATLAELSRPNAISNDSLGNLYVTDAANSRIRKIDAGGNISTVAGTTYTTPGYLGDGGPATQAQLYLLAGKVAFDPQGSLYIGDYGNQRVRQVTPDGIIHTLVGTGTTGTPIPNGTPASEAPIASPNGIWYGSGGNIYFVSEIASTIYRYNAGDIYNVAGSPGTWGAGGQEGDGGPAAKAFFNHPTNMVIDQQGNLFIADFANNKIREINTNGIITTVAGNGQAGLSGDGGPAAAAELNGPYGLAIDADGNLYIADTFNHRIRKVILH